MVDDFAILDRIRDGVKIGDAAAQQFDAIGGAAQVRGVAGAEIVEDAHRLILGKQRVHQMRADESRAAGDETSPHVEPPQIGVTCKRDLYSSDETTMPPLIDAMNSNS